ncbi:MAG TPA: type I polyketide synthase, partial [Candidatus Dormibacteraeota bacterium]|nr:type I polyketide synthase [Candidatus Dormibacteraeota bacterium]
MASSPSIAIVGMACVYPDARTPGELWENVLAQRRAFRTLPDERFRLQDYWSADRSKPDSSYSAQGAVIEGYEFDRVAFRVVGSTYRAADLAHWLALDVASRALGDAGFVDGRGLPRESTGVLVGNTLTGEFSRAGLMRLRWPYVRRKVEAALTQEGWPEQQRAVFLQKLETEYKEPFAPVGEESLAGGLSNTIAGRICNHFDLKGGGYTVDGACASSLLATANACSALAAGDLDAALAGGVDLSLDPFELVGFAKTGALAVDEMRVFDRDSAGFWPGEGCGFVVLMRHEDALAQGCRVYAVIRGWGISSDGKGGITRPEAAGQLEAIRRAYRRAKFGPETVMYCEAHGTGTSVGDATELEVLSKARRPEIPVPIPWGERQGDSQRGERQRAAIGSIKANIGHTKAAAGLASLIKATMAVHTQVLPPTTGCEHPVASCGESNSPLRVLREAEVWPEHEPLRASVSAMGFGGINAHLVLESTAGERRHALSTRERALSSTSQDAELFLFAGSDLEHLRLQVIRALLWAGRISRSELTDAAAQLQAELQPLKTRASVVASTPAELFERLQKLSKLLEKQPAAKPVFADGIFFRLAQKNPRLAFLFPGQGSPTYLDGGLWARRFDSVRKLYAVAALRSENDEDAASTRIAQPAIVTASLAGLKVLEKFGIRADVALGHSLGEITALQWAGVLSEEALLRIARVRGAAMAELGTPTGTMLAIAAPAETVQPLIKGQRAWVVGLNSPQQTVIGGESVAIERVARIAKRAGWHTTPLQVSHAFHTPLVAAARPLLEEQLAQEDFVRPNAQVISTVTGKALSGRDSLPELLSRQITSPVRFTDALAALLSEGIDLCIEVGPGSVLSGLVRESSDVPVIALDSAGSSVRGLLQAFGAAFALGMPVRAEALFADRFVRPFNLDWKPKFFANPCEAGVITNEQSALSVPLAPSDVQRASLPSEVNLRKEAVTGQSQGSHTSYTPLQVLRQLVSDRAELPLSAVTNESRMLADLHLNSITVSQLVSEAARRLQLPRITSLLDFANARIGEIAQALEDLRQTGKRPDAEKPQLPAGAGAWVEAFNTELVPAPLNRTGPTSKAVSGQSSWQFFSSPGNRLSAPLREKLETSNRSGVVVCLPEPADENSISLLLDAARAAPNLKPGGLFLLVQHGWGGSGFAKTLHLETGITTCVVNVPPDHPKAVDLLTNEAASASRFVEAFYDRDGHRSEPRLVPMETAEGSSSAPRFPVTKRDVLLVTGGGKGIAAECALALGRDSGAALALLGRSDPKTDPELAANLKRIQAAGVSCCYVQADVTDEPAVRRAIKTAERKLGPITGVLHGAGLNTPRLISSLDADTFRQTLAPKVNGLRNVLSAVDSKRLRLLVTFSSIIARAGLPGEADYATANEWLSAMTKDFQNEHPRCRCLAVEWSVWAGVGMGERLGRVEALLQQGITPIPTDEGVAKLLQLLKSPPSQTAVVVSGRFGEPPTLKVKEAELPLHRFLERKLVHYPGIELVVDAELSLQNDPYLNDHVVQGERLFPAVLGLEAMAQAAMALCGQSAPSFEQVNLA